MFGATRADWRSTRPEHFNQTVFSFNQSAVGFHHWSMFDFQLVVDSRPSVVSCQVIEYRLEGFRYANLSHLRIELPEISAECIAIHPLEQTPPYSVRMTFG